MSPADIQALVSAVRANHTAEFRALAAQGLSRPPVFPYILLATFYVPGLYLAIPHTNRPWLYRLRFAVMALILAVNVKMMTNTSGANPAMAFGAGLYLYWSIMNCFSSLIWQRAQFEAERVQKVRTGTRRTTDKVVMEEGPDIEGKRKGNGAVDGVKHSTNDHADSIDVANSDGAGDSQDGAAPRVRDGIVEHAPQDSDIMQGEPGYEYFWEPFPADAPFGHRFNWAMDLVTNLRGEGWNFAIPTIPHPPPPETPGSGERVKLELIPKTARSGYTRCSTTKEYLIHRLSSLALAYLFLDAINILLIRDPYFALNTTTDWPAPPHLTAIPAPLLHLSRSVLVIITIYAFVYLVVAYIDLIQFFIGGHFFPVRREPWCHCSIFGSAAEVFERGLAGFWGGWWHQTFRVPFTAPITWLVKRGYLRSRSAPAKFVGYVSAFVNSGILHACGSYTAVAPTKPYRFPLFFSFSAVGVLLQQAVCYALRNPLAKVPRSVRKTGNVVFVLAWLFITYWPLAADFTSAGVFLLEPVPVSIIRGLGFGLEGEKWWWRWGDDYMLTWYWGARWWESGFCFGL